MLSVLYRIWNCNRERNIIMEPVRMIEKKRGIVIKVYQDSHSENPRDWDNLGTMLYTSNKYDLGDEQADIEDIKEITERNDIVYLPVYVYDHSVIYLNTTGFSCPWDSGQCGIIYVDYETIAKEYGDTITQGIREQVENVLKSEVNMFSQYCEGDIYGYVIEDFGGECLESCWGFYGMDCCVKEAEGEAQYRISEEIKASRLDNVLETVEASLAV